MERVEVIASKRGYQVTECGKLISFSGIEIGSLNQSGYRATNIRINGNLVKLWTHRLQAYQKYGDTIFNEGIEVRHKNGISYDNSYENILIGTHSQNMQDIPESIRIRKAIHASSHIKKHDHEAIRAHHAQSKSYKKTMDAFGIKSKGTMSYIINSSNK